MNNLLETNEYTTNIHYSLHNQDFIPKKAIIWSIKCGQN